MTRKFYSEDEVLRTLSLKKDVRIDARTKTMQLLHHTSKDKVNDLGNTSWGKIDFLTKYCGYSSVYLDEWPKDDDEKKKKWYD